jgi:hypothetical protein
MINNNTKFIILTIIISLTLIELLTRLKISPPDYAQYDNRYMLFNENDIFKNQNNFFLYHPNKVIKSTTFYEYKNQFIKEYSYYIHTNNFGLVQKNDLDASKKSILFLGDSFTEGQGAEAWIDNFDGYFKELQVINGGILGTGPQQFLLLENYISQNFDIRKVVFIFLGEDYMRGTFNFPENVMLCLKNQNNCKGDEGFYGLKKNEKNNVNSFLQKLKKFRENKDPKNFKYYIKKFRNSIDRLNIISIPKNFIKSNIYKTKNSNFSKNLDSTKKLINIYKDNIIFIRLNTKNEIMHGKSYWSNNAEQEIKKMNKKIFYCNFNNDINLFYKYDSHPNKIGYDYLYSCINKILKINEL